MKQPLPALLATLLLGIPAIFADFTSGEFSVGVAAANAATASGSLTVQIGTRSQTEIDDTDSSIIYSRGNSSEGIQSWGIGSNPNDHNGDEHYSNQCASPAFQINGAAAVENFSGTGITWIGKLGHNFGRALLSVDGGAPVTIDNYNPASELDQQSLYTISGLAPGSHALKIEVTCNKNASAVDTFQVSDAFEMQGTPLSQSSGTVVGYNSPALTYSNGWDCGANADDLSGGHCWNNAANASVSWNFTGSLLEVYGRPDVEDGIFNVLIDGQQVGQVDSHWGTVDDDALNSYPFFVWKGAPGSHTVELVGTGTKDGAATNTYLQFDEFIAFP